jgi:hypothetical protein
VLFRSGNLVSINFIDVYMVARSQTIIPGTYDTDTTEETPTTQEDICCESEEQT